MNNEKPKIILLHPFPTSWEFIEEACELGFEIWATRDEEVKIPERVEALMSGYLKSSLYDSSAITAEIGKLSNVKFVYPGSDLAVVVAAELSSNLGLPGNSVEVARKTRYKDLMRAAAQKIAPECTPKYFLIVNESDLKRAAEQAGFPAVFKRTEFAGSYGVKMVQNMVELKECFVEQASLSKLPLGEPIRPIYLLEEYIEGPEFSVETITIGGETHILGVTKKTTGPEPYFIEIKHEFPAEKFEVSEKQVGEMGVLAKRVTEAIGMQYCVGHFEVRWSEKENCPKIIEFSSRTGGGQIPRLIKLVAGMYPWRPLLDLFLTETKFQFNKIKYNGIASALHVCAGSSGYFKGLRGVEEVKKDKSYVCSKCDVSLGQKIDLTNTYKDRIVYYIGHSSGIEEMRVYQKTVSSLKIMVLKNEYN